MSNVRDDSHHTRHPMTRLFWVGVIAAVASFLTGYLGRESLIAAVGFALASAVISVAIVALLFPVRSR